MSDLNEPSSAPDALRFVVLKSQGMFLKHENGIDLREAAGTTLIGYPSSSDPNSPLTYGETVNVEQIARNLNVPVQQVRDRLEDALRKADDVTPSAPKGDDTSQAERPQLPRSAEAA